MSTPEFGVSIGENDDDIALVESLRFAVPLAIRELLWQHPGGVPLYMLKDDASRIGTYSDVLMCPPGYRGQTRGPQRAARQANGFALAHNGLVRGLAALAIMTPEGVTFAGLHWCTRPHADCPTPPRAAAKPATAEEIAELVALADEYEAAVARNGYKRRAGWPEPAKAAGR
jgi:hypothetical protein